MDDEWGVPIYGRRNDTKLFELLSLEGAQAGLSWDCILRKREAYRRAFKGFDIKTVARFTKRQIDSLVRMPGEGSSVIVKNRAKIESVVNNALRCLEVIEKCGSFSRFLWSFVGGQPRENRFRHPREIPAKTEEAEAMSKALKKLGFGFVGPTVCYAFMQSAGMVNDHPLGTPQHDRVKRLVAKMRFAE